MLKGTVVRRKSDGVGPIKAASVEAPPFRLFEPLQTEAPSSEVPVTIFFFSCRKFYCDLQLEKLICVGVWKMEPPDPDFYKIGFARSFRAYGVEFREGPCGFGVYASRDVEPLRRARVSLFFYCRMILDSGYS